MTRLTTHQNRLAPVLTAGHSCCTSLPAVLTSPSPHRRAIAPGSPSLAPPKAAVGVAEGGAAWTPLLAVAVLAEAPEAVASCNCREEGGKGEGGEWEGGNEWKNSVVAFCNRSGGEEGGALRCGGA